jgi:transcriptional regulator with XRE-family HTH domain
MNEPSVIRSKLPLLNRYIDSLCGLYSRIARQLNVDRSYVSRVARGERQSKQVEQALIAEFDRVTEEQSPQETADLSPTSADRV